MAYLGIGRSIFLRRIEAVRGTLLAELEAVTGNPLEEFRRSGAIGTSGEDALMLSDPSQTRRQLHMRRSISVREKWSAWLSIH